MADGYASEYIVTGEFLVGVADQARRLSGVDDKFTTDEMKAALEAAVAALDASTVAFAATHTEDNTGYRMGYNWFADLVALTQGMAGTASALTPAQILEELSRVIYIPQGRAESEITNGGFRSEIVTINPVYQEIAAQTVIEILGRLYSEITIPEETT